MHKKLSLTLIFLLTVCSVLAYNDYVDINFESPYTINNLSGQPVGPVNWTGTTKNTTAVIAGQWVNLSDDSSNTLTNYSKNPASSTYWISFDFKGTGDGSANYADFFIALANTSSYLVVGCDVSENLYVYTGALLYTIANGGAGTGCQKTTFTNVKFFINESAGTFDPYYGGSLVTSGLTRNNSNAVDISNFKFKADSEINTNPLYVDNLCVADVVEMCLTKNITLDTANYTIVDYNGTSNVVNLSFNLSTTDFNIGENVSCSLSVNGRLNVTQNFTGNATLNWTNPLTFNDTVLGAGSNFWGVNCSQGSTTAYSKTDYLFLANPYYVNNTAPANLTVYNNSPSVVFQVNLTGNNLTGNNWVNYTNVTCDLNVNDVNNLTTGTIMSHNSFSLYNTGTLYNQVRWTVGTSVTSIAVTSGKWVNITDGSDGYTGTTLDSHGAEYWMNFSFKGSGDGSADFADFFEGGDGTNAYILVGCDASENLYAYNGTSRLRLNGTGTGCRSTSFKEIKFFVNETASTFDVYYDGTLKGRDMARNSGSAASITVVRLKSDSQINTNNLSVDAIMVDGKDLGDVWVNSLNFTSVNFSQTKVDQTINWSVNCSRGVHVSYPDNYNFFNISANSPVTLDSPSNNSFYSYGTSLIFSFNLSTNETGDFNTALPVNCSFYLNGALNKTFTQNLTSWDNPLNVSNPDGTPTVYNLTPSDYNWSVNCSQGASRGRSDGNFTVTIHDYMFVNLTTPSNETTYNASLNTAFAANTTGAGWKFYHNATCDMYLNDVYNQTVNLTPNVYCGGNNTVFCSTFNTPTYVNGGLAGQNGWTGETGSNILINNQMIKISIFTGGLVKFASKSVSYYNTSFWITFWMKGTAGTDVTALSYFLKFINTTGSGITVGCNTTEDLFISGSVGIVDGCIDPNWRKISFYVKPATKDFDFYYDDTLMNENVSMGTQKVELNLIQLTDSAALGNGITYLDNMSIYSDAGSDTVWENITFSNTSITQTIDSQNFNWSSNCTQDSYVTYPVNHNFFNMTGSVILNTPLNNSVFDGGNLTGTPISFDVNISTIDFDTAQDITCDLYINDSLNKTTNITAAWSNPLTVGTGIYFIGGSYKWKVNCSQGGKPVYTKDNNYSYFNITSYNVFLDTPENNTGLYVINTTVIPSFNLSGGWDLGEDVVCDLYINDSLNETKQFTAPLTNPLNMSDKNLSKNYANEVYNWSVNCTDVDNHTSYPYPVNRIVMLDNVPNIINRTPINNSYITDYLLNGTYVDDDLENGTVKFYGDNTSSPTTLLYVFNDTFNGTVLSYNHSLNPVKYWKICYSNNYYAENCTPTWFIDYDACFKFGGNTLCPCQYNMTEDKNVTGWLVLNNTGGGVEVFNVRNYTIRFGNISYGNPIAHYSFDDNDTVGGVCLERVNGIDGTINGAVTGEVGQFNEAYGLLFMGVTDVYTGTDDRLQIVNGSWGGWFKMSQAPFLPPSNLLRYGAAYYIRSEVDNFGIYSCGIQNENGEYSVSLTGSPDLSYYRNVFCTYNGSSLKIYLDGELDNEASYSEILGYTGSDTLMMGNEVGLFNYVGWMDEIYIFNSTLSQKQIHSLFENNLISASNSIWMPKNCSMYQEKEGKIIW